MDPKKSQIDTTFGIRCEYGDWMIGNKRIKINGDDITIDGEVYDGTSGLWSLISEVLYETSAMHHQYNSHDPRASGWKKWTLILAPIWKEFEMTGVVASNDDDETDSVDGTLVDKDSDDREGELQDSRTTLDDYDDESVGEGIMRIYLHKDGRCFGLRKCGEGIKFTPRPRLGGIHGSGLYLRVGSSIYDGEGLLLGSKSPFKKIPILGWIL